MIHTSFLPSKYNLFSEIKKLDQSKLILLNISCFSATTTTTTSTTTTLGNQNSASEVQKSSQTFKTLRQRVINIQSGQGSEEFKDLHVGLLGIKLCVERYKNNLEAIHLTKEVDNCIVTLIGMSAKVDLLEAANVFPAIKIEINNISFVGQKTSKKEIHEIEVKLKKQLKLIDEYRILKDFEPEEVFKHESIVNECWKLFESKIKTHTDEAGNIYTTLLFFIPMKQHFRVIKIILDIKAMT